MSSELRNAEQALEELVQEENHLRMLHNVFGQGDGPKVLEWILDACGYWNAAPQGERAVGKLDFARYLYNQVSMADPEVTYAIIALRRNSAEEQRRADRLAAEKKIKELREQS